MDYQTIIENAKAAQAAHFADEQAKQKKAENDKEQANLLHKKEGLRVLQELIPADLIDFVTITSTAWTGLFMYTLSIPECENINFVAYLNGGQRGKFQTKGTPELIVNGNNQELYIPYLDFDSVELAISQASQTYLQSKTVKDEIAAQPAKQAVLPAPVAQTSAPIAKAKPSMPTIDDFLTAFNSGDYPKAIAAAPYEIAYCK